MTKALLNDEQVARLVLANKYKVVEKNKFLSRCIDGRYPNDDDLPALAMPGADAGELAVIFATTNVYGLEIDREKVFKVLSDIVGGVKNSRFHTDTHAEKGAVCAGCGHMKQMRQDSAAFNINKEDVDFIMQKLSAAKQKGAQETVLQGEHEEGAVLNVKGNYGVLPQFSFESGEGPTSTQVFVFHDSLVNQRHKALAEKLISDKAITLKNDDKDYLYTVLTETAENHLFEIAKRLAKGLPLYSVEFDEDGHFDLKLQGNV